jgi:hypothetical protein
MGNVFGGFLASDQACPVRVPFPVAGAYDFDVGFLHGFNSGMFLHKKQQKRL